jgi:hypothetical protein
MKKKDSTRPIPAIMQQSNAKKDLLSDDDFIPEEDCSSAEETGHSPYIHTARKPAKVQMIPD